MRMIGQHLVISADTQIAKTQAYVSKHSLRVTLAQKKYLMPGPKHVSG